ncbi:tyrosine-type recombinase/integrase [Paracoccaceae bacterium]|nr:tyrosine-type recombinase/integrase [Paracoccaceae bacterium]
MPTINCNIDRRSIEKATKQQRELGAKVTLVDPSGLRLAINARSASWNYNYRKRGVDHYGKRHPQKTLRLGDPLTLTPQEARLRVEEIKAEVRNGGDPATTLARKADEQRQYEFQQRPVEIWLDQYQQQVLGDASKHKREEYMHAKSALSELGIKNASPSQVTKRVIREIISMHIDRPSTARHRFGALSRFLDYLVDEEVIERNPARLISLRHRPKAPAQRTAYYSIKQLKKLWSPEHALREDYLRFLRFMIICPLRMTEASELTSQNIFTEEQELRLSPTATKNNEPFTLPIPRVASDLLSATNVGQSGRYFQLSSKLDEPMKAWSYFNKAVRRATGISEFNLHDLRRTFTSLLSEHSPFSESLLDSLLNHKRSSTRTGVMRAYRHAKNVKQRREIMEWWGEFLEREVIKPSAEASGDQN